MTKIAGLAKSAIEDSMPFGSFGDDDEVLLHWPETEQLGICQGSDAIVISAAQAGTLIVRLVDFVKRSKTAMSPDKPQPEPEKTSFIYVLTERGEPWTTTKSREHAFELCRKKFGMVSFGWWIEGKQSIVTQNGVAVANIYCMEVAR